MDVWIVTNFHTVIGVYSTYERAAIAAELQNRNGHLSEIWQHKVNGTELFAKRLGDYNGTQEQT